VAVMAEPSFARGISVGGNSFPFRFACKVDTSAEKEDPAAHEPGGVARQKAHRFLQALRSDCQIHDRSTRSLQLRPAPRTGQATNFDCFVRMVMCTFPPKADLCGGLALLLPRPNYDRCVEDDWFFV
jgi:hypothetical protein